MARRILTTYLGKLHKLSNNPRVISDGAFTMLCESMLGQDEKGNKNVELLGLNNIIVWMVPTELPGKRDDWPWEGQEGKLVILSGNQRYDALVEMAYERIPDEWIKPAKYANGEWISPEHAEKVILLMNSPEGVSGETDYDKLVAKFDAMTLKAVGMDFAQTPLDFQEKMSGPVEDEVEQGEHGEQDQELTDFKKRREDSRGNLEEILDMGFYDVVYFETHDQKMLFNEFLKEKYGVDANRDIFINGFKISEALGKKIEYSGLKFPDSRPSRSLQEMAMDGTEFGWEKDGDVMPDGTEPEEEDGEKIEDGSGIDGVI